MLDVGAEAARFAEDLADLLNGTVTTGTQLFVTATDDQNARITASERVRAPSVIPLSTDPDPEARAAAKLWLRIEFKLGADDEGEHARVERSVMGLCVDPKTAMCAMRIEYDRAYSQALAAHLNVAGESTLLGYAFAAAGATPKPLEKVHFPNGGRRFRPTVEDFIDFLIAEDLIPDRHDTWRETLERHRHGWLQRQTRAATRRNPDAAADQLRAMGYSITAPP